MVLSNLTTEHSTNLILDDLATRNDNWTVLDDIVTAVPSSGAAGQVLAKVDATDYNTGWVAVSTVGANAKNKIINGNFDIWQRGTSFSATGTAAYLADRWYSAMLNTTQAVSLQAFTVGQTDVPYEPAYFHRSVVVSAAAAGNYARLSQRIESVKTFAGQTVTLSFYAKADAAKNIAVEFVQNFGTGGSPSADVTTIGTVKKALTTGWVKQTVTAAIPSISGKTLGTTHDGYLAVVFWFNAGSDFNARTDTLGQQSGTFDIAQVQVEAGSFATPFEKRLIGAELSLCQRYYTYDIPWGQPPTCWGVARTTGMVSTNVKYPVQMRVKPTVVLFSYNNTPGAICAFAATDDIAAVITSAQNGHSGYISIDATVSVGVHYWWGYKADAEL